jgi:hypothetical protein
VSTPTVKARYDRLVNMGLVKSVKPEIDLSKIDIHKQKHFFSEENIKQLHEQNKHLHIKIDNLKIKMLCEYCGGPINSNPKCSNLQIFSDSFAVLASRIITTRSMQAGYSQ